MLFNENKVIILMLSLICFNSIESCQIFETKRTCECSLIFNMNGSMSIINLFDLPSYDDCGINLGKRDTNKPLFF